MALSDAMPLSDDVQTLDNVIRKNYVIAETRENSFFNETKSLKPIGTKFLWNSTKIIISSDLKWRI